jgi:hypothetical protein
LQLGEPERAPAIDFELPFGELLGIERIHGFHDSGQTTQVTEKRRLLSKFWFCVLLMGAQGSASGEARANGRFPEANQVVFDPRDSRHLLVRTTFGLLESRDGAGSFSWTCEKAFDLSGEADPMLALTASGAQIVTTFSGIWRSADGCSYRAPPELAGENVPDLALDPNDPQRLLAFRVESLGSGLFDSALVRSEDEGQTWVSLQPPLPSDLLPLSVDFAGSDSERIYLSARSGASSGYVSVLLRSLDAGQTFERFEIPGTEQQKLAFIAGVDPTDAGRVFVRVDDSLGTRVLVSVDAGQTFRELFRASARLPGFAIAKDGSELALGGPNDGLWVGALDGTGLQQRSSVAPSCLGYGPDGLYACSDATQLGSLLLRSRDGGTTFETLATFDSLCGTTGCEPVTEVARSCRAEWESIAPTLGTTCGTAATPNPPSASSSSFRAAGGGCALTSGGAATRSWFATLILLSFAAALRSIRGARRRYSP